MNGRRFAITIEIDETTITESGEHVSGKIVKIVPVPVRLETGHV